jgi:hypothetical protein
LTNLPAANLTGTLPALSGASLTNLPAANLTGTLPALSGASLTNLPAANLTGTVADARISALTASKLTGALPAISGASLTGLPSTTDSKFLAYKSANSLNATGDGTTLAVVFDTEVFDQNSDYATTGIFTAPTTGKYLFTCWINFTGITANTADYWELQLITSNRTFVHEYDNQNDIGDGLAIRGTWITDLDTSDTAKIQIGIWGDSKVADLKGGTNLKTSFAGCLLA